MIRNVALVAAAISALAFAPVLLSGKASGSTPTSHSGDKPVQRHDAGFKAMGDGGSRHQGKTRMGGGDSGSSALGGDGGMSAPLGADGGRSRSLGADGGITKTH